MAGRLLTDMSLDSALVGQMHQQQLMNARDVLVLSLVDLTELLDITWTQAEALRMTVSAHVAPPFRTALQMNAERAGLASHLLTTLPALDSALRGGLMPGSITELVGPAGVGKSQFCCMMTLHAALPRTCCGQDGTVVYIDTEGKFKPQRLEEMAQARHSEEVLPLPALQTSFSSVLLFKPQSIEDLLHCLHTVAQMPVERRLTLVVLDSVAALARHDHGGSAGVVDRQEVLGQVASQLKVIAESRQVPVLVTNQVTAKMSGASATHTFQQHPGGPPGQVPGSSTAGPHQQYKWDGPAGADTGGQAMAALGTKWAHCVNVRLILERLGDCRLLHVAKSPSCGHVMLEYEITSCGPQQLRGPAELGVSTGSRSVTDTTIRNDRGYG